MIVRIQLGTGRRVQRAGGKNRRVAQACGALLAPVALMAYVLGFWRLASDIEVVAPSGITGPFSHWQVAMGAGVFLTACSRMLARYGQQGEFRMPEALRLRLLPLRPAEGDAARRSKSS